MPAVRIEAKLWGDPRLEIFAAKLRVDRYSAIGRLAALWSGATEDAVFILPAPIVDVLLGQKGGAKALVAANLGEVVEGGIRIKGAADRLDWLAKARRGAENGGKKNKERLERLRTEKETETAKASGSPQAIPGAIPQALVSGAPAKPPQSPLVLAPALALPIALSPDPKKNTPREKPAEPSGDHHRFIHAFQELYLKRWDVLPIWEGKQHGQVTTLLKRGGLEEAIKRARFMFDAPAKFPTERPDLATLFTHWDKLAMPITKGTNGIHKGGGMSAADMQRKFMTEEGQ